MQLTVKDAARYLRVPETTIYQWIQAGEIPVFKLHGSHRFNRTELLEWAIARKLPIAPDVCDSPGCVCVCSAPASPEPADHPDGHEAPLPTVLAALTAGGIHTRVPGRDRETVLKSVVGLLPLPATVDRQFLFQSLLAREALGSTALGDGIAIPHVRNPIILQVDQPAIALCYLESAIDFGALDGKPVGILFAMISTTVRVHLHLLARLAFILKSPARAVILAGGAPQPTEGPMPRREQEVPVLRPLAILDAIGRAEAALVSVPAGPAPHRQ